MTFQTSDMIDDGAFTRRILFEDHVINIAILGYQIDKIFFLILTSSSRPYPAGPKAVERTRRIVFWWILSLDSQAGRGNCCSQDVFKDPETLSSGEYEGCIAFQRDQEVGNLAR
jgi:hypothetical protein